MAQTISGVTFEGTRDGKLDESALPTEGFCSHYLVCGDTKSESSYPVVDADNMLRRGNVSAAWDLRNNAEDGPSEESLRKLGRQFDDNPLPDSEEGENAEFRERSSGSRIRAKSQVSDGETVEVDSAKSDQTFWICVHPSEGENYNDGTVQFGSNIAEAGPYQKGTTVKNATVELEEEITSGSYFIGLHYDDNGEMGDHMVNSDGKYIYDLIYVNVTEQTEEPMEVEVDGEYSIEEDSDKELRFSTQLTAPEPQILGEGFNEYGVKENRDENGELASVEAVYRAMEPGPPEERKGVRITEEFLESVAGKNYSDEPHMLDHSKEALKKAGELENVFFSGGVDPALYVHVKVPNTGSSIKDDYIADLTHEPPAIKNGSVGFGTDYEVEINENGEPEMVDGRLQEFSATPFPAGYDDGGLASGGFSESEKEAYWNNIAIEFVCNFLEEDKMEFSTVETTEDLEEMGEEELREVVKKYSEVNEKNKQVFEEAQEGSVEEEEIAEYRQKLASEVAESSPLEEEELQEYSLSRLDELREEFSGEDEDKKFSNMGEEKETHDPDGDAEYSEAKERVGSIDGLVVE